MDGRTFIVTKTNMSITDLLSHRFFYACLYSRYWTVVMFFDGKITEDFTSK